MSSEADRSPVGIPDMTGVITNATGTGGIHASAPAGGKVAEGVSGGKGRLSGIAAEPS